MWYNAEKHPPRESGCYLGLAVGEHRLWMGFFRYDAYKGCWTESLSTNAKCYPVTELVLWRKLPRAPFKRWRRLHKK